MDEDNPDYLVHEISRRVSGKTIRSASRSWEQKETVKRFEQLWFPSFTVSAFIPAT